MRRELSYGLASDIVRQRTRLSLSATRAQSSVIGAGIHLGFTGATCKTIHDIGAVPVKTATRLLPSRGLKSTIQLARVRAPGRCATIGPRRPAAPEREHQTIGGPP